MSNQKNTVRKSVNITVDKELAGRLSFLRNFTHKLPGFSEKLEAMIVDFCVQQEKIAGVTPSSWLSSRPCPACSTGVLFPRTKKQESKPSFMGCSKFPICRHTENYQSKG